MLSQICDTRFLPDCEQPLCLARYGIVELRTYRNSAAAIMFTVMTVGWAGITIIAGHAWHWNPMLLLPLGAATAAFAILSVNSFQSGTIISDAGVQPTGPKSKVVPWREIEVFTVGPPLKGNAAVFLIRTENRRPIKLEAMERPPQQAQDTADELNAILQAKPRRDANLGTSAGQRCYVRATARNWVGDGPAYGFIEAQLVQSDGAEVTIYGKGDAIGWCLPKPDSPPDALLLAKVVAVPEGDDALTVRLFRAEDRAGNTDFTVSRALITTAPNG